MECFRRMVPCLNVQFSFQAVHCVGLPQLESIQMGDGAFRFTENASVLIMRSDETSEE